MKFICPNCESSIHKSNVNIKEGIAQCVSCDEVFRIADFINGKEIRRTEKPIYTKVQIEDSSDKLVITIPPVGWNQRTIFLTLFALILSFIPFFNTELKGFVLFIGIVSLWCTVIYRLVRRLKITMDSKYIKVQWFALIYLHARKGKTKRLKEVTEEVLYTNNYEPMYGIGLIFKGGDKIKFGSHLNEGERKWLIGELYEKRRQLISKA